MRLSERITRWRGVKGITQAELARRVGVSSAAVNQWEDKDDDKATEPTHEHVGKIADALDLTLSEFWADPPAVSRTTTPTRKRRASA